MFDPYLIVLFDEKYGDGSFARLMKFMSVGTVSITLIVCVLGGAGFWDWLFSHTFLKIGNYMLPLLY